ncbi:tRNA (uracil-5-)-methyltransferase, partial [Pasteurella multocida RIIF]
MQALLPIEQYDSLLAEKQKKLTA